MYTVRPQVKNGIFLRLYVSYLFARPVFLCMFHRPLVFGRLGCLIDQTGTIYGASLVVLGRA